MQVRVFTIPMDGDPEAIEELNAFLRGQKVLSVEKVAVVDHGRHYWSLCVEYLPRCPTDTRLCQTTCASDSNPSRLDYRKILSNDEFDRFAQLRVLRKQLAEAEGVPVYTILTNAQLADVARAAPQTRTTLGAIDGLGPAKLDRYGEPLLAMLRTMLAPASAAESAVAAEAPFEPPAAPPPHATNGPAPARA